jgi:hypothetical protein
VCSWAGLGPASSMVCAIDGNGGPFVPLGSKSFLAGSPRTTPAF